MQTRDIPAVAAGEMRVNVRRPALLVRLEPSHSRDPARDSGEPNFVELDEVAVQRRRIPLIGADAVHDLGV